MSGDVPAIEVRNLNVSYNREAGYALRDVNIDIPRGLIVAVVGPNGAGKSSFIKAVMGVHGHPIFGSGPDSPVKIQVLGKDHKAQIKAMSYMPQRESTDWDFPCRVVDMVRMGVYAKWPLHHLAFRFLSREDKAVADKALERTGLSEYANRQVGKLSGGQRKRLQLARALADEGEVYLLDEPMAGVDVPTEKALFNVMKELKAAGKTVVVIHHDLKSVPQFFDYVVMIRGGIIAAGPLDTAFTQENGNNTYGGVVDMGLPRP